MRTILNVVVLLLPVLLGGMDAAYPDPALIGASASQEQRFIVSTTDDAVSPAAIKLELRKARIVGVVAQYPKGVTVSLVRDSINRDWAACERQAGAGMYVWRNEEKRFAISLAEEDGLVTLIMRSIDREILRGNKPPGSGAGSKP
jgi:hypothetical protein